MSGTSSRQVVVQDLASERLFVRAVDPVTMSNVAVTGSNHSVLIYNNSGSVIETISSGGSFASSDTNLVTLTHTFPKATYPLGNYYKAVWTIHVSGTGMGSVFRTFVTYFSTVLRRFTPTLSIAEFTARHPYVVAQVPTNHSISSFLQRAWEKISLNLWKKQDSYPGNIFHPEDFALAHEYLTLGEFFLSIAFSADPRDEDIKKHELYTAKGFDALSLATSKIAIDINEDGRYSKSEERYLSQLRVVR